MRKMERIKEKKSKNQCVNVRFTDVWAGDPRNAAISTEQTEAVAGANAVNFADREVLSPFGALRRADRRKKSRGGSNNGDFLVSMIPVLTAVRFVVLTGCADKNLSDIDLSAHAGNGENGRISIKICFY